MAEVQFIPVTKDGYRMDVHPDALEAYLKTGWVVISKEQTGGGPTLKDTTAESGQKKAAKKAEVK